MSAQPTDAEAENKILIYDRPAGPILLRLDGGAFGFDGSSVRKHDLFIRYVFEGRDYRKLSRSEAARFDATPKVEARHGCLRFNGRRIRTNLLWVTKVDAAFHWKGGVAVVAKAPKGWPFLPGRSEGKIGFIDIKTNRCRFAGFNWEQGDWPVSLDFLVPVTINAANGDLVLEVSIPERVSIFEKFDLVFSLTNRSDRAVALPDSLADGLGIVRTDRMPIVSEGARGRHGFGGFRPYPKKHPENLDDPGHTCSSLAPFQERGSAFPLDAREMFYRPGRYRVVFYWDGFLDPGDKESMSRFLCEKWVDVTAPTIDTSNKDLALDVSMPRRVSARGFFDIAISLTNVSDRTVPVPDSLVDGLGVVLMYQGRESFGEDATERQIRAKRPVFRIPHHRVCSPLGPKERRESVASFDAKRFFRWPGSYRAVIYWDGLLDPNDKEKATRFAASDVLVDAVR